MGSNGSFYQNGLPVSALETGVGNVTPLPPVTNKGNSSFYLEGSAYAALLNSDALLAAITAQQVLATAGASSAASSAVAAAASAGSMVPSATLPAMDGVAAVGTLANYTRADHVHPTDTTRAALASPAFTGVPTSPTAAALNNSTQLATTAYADAATATLSGTVTTALALKAPLASPSLTGVPVAPTATALNNSTQLATTAYADAATSVLSGTVNTALALKAPLASPSFTGTFGSAALLPTFGPGGTGASQEILLLNGGSAAGGGSGVKVQKNGTDKWFIGTRSVFSSDTSDDLIYFNSVLGVTAMRMLGSDSSVIFPSTTDSTSVGSGAITTSGGLGVAKSAWIGGTLNVAGIATGPTAAVDTNTTQLATTAMVLAQAASATPLIDATAAVVGVSTRFARGDHVHPTDTTRAAQVPGTTTVASLPSASSNAGARFVVTDASSLSYGATVAGGGASHIPVFSDGTSWRQG